MTRPKAVCVSRQLRFEALEDRMLMSADPTAAMLSTAMVVGNPTPASSTVDSSGSGAILVSETIQGPPAVFSPAPFSTQATLQLPDGQTLVAGVENGGFALARYNSDGTLDTSFGTDGVTTFGNLNLVVVQQIQLASDGSIYLVGEAAVSGTAADQISGDGGSWWNSPDETTSLIHVGADGSVDTTYGNGGILSLNDPLTLPTATIQDDGKIVVASNNCSDNGLVAVQVVNRYNADGTPDTSFQYQPGELPYVGIQPGGPILVDSQGRIVLSGMSADGANLMRLNSDGTVDTTFGTDGVQNVPQLTSSIYTLTELSDGTILINGTVELNSDGSSDPTSPGSQTVSPPIAVASPPVEVDSPPIEVFSPPMSPVVPVTASPDPSSATQPQNAEDPIAVGIPVADPAPLMSAPTAPTTVEPVSSQVAQASQPTPVIMAAQVVTLPPPAATIVTNPSAGTPGASAQVPAAPTTAAAVAALPSIDDASTTTDDTSAGQLAASLAAIDVVFAFAGN